MSVVVSENPVHISLNQKVAYTKAEVLTPIQLHVKAISPPPPNVAITSSPPLPQHFQHPHRPIPRPVQQHRMSNSMLASPYNNLYGTRRTPSAATTSYDSYRTSSTLSGDMRRSSSTRSGVTVSGYVASMRKQKATVWCDRSQPEDPRTLAQQRAAKSRANMEILGAAPHGSSLSSGSGKATKIRHAPKQGGIGYSPAEMVRGVDTMMPKLSAAEAGEGSSDDESYRNGLKGRTGSGRSSIASSKRHTMSGIMRPVDSSSSSSLNRLRMSEGPMDPDKTLTGLSQGSRHSSLGDGESTFGALGQLSERKPVVPKTYTQDELRRRGSVDDRALGAASVRLFIANPDD